MWYDDAMIRRVRLALFHVASALSLLVFAETSRLWVRSFDVNPSWDYIRPNWMVRFTAGSGQTVFEWDTASGGFYGPRPRRLEYREAAPTKLDLKTYFGLVPPETRREWGGFGYWAGVKPLSNGRIRFRIWAVPCWFPPLLTAPLSAYWCVRVYRGCRRSYREWVRRRQLARNRCTGCWYDLTGNVSGVCPECGTPVIMGATA